MERVSAKVTGMKNYHEIAGLRFEGLILVAIIDGIERRFSVSDISPVLVTATEVERKAFEIPPSGYGIHWPLLDEDLSVDALLGISHHRKERHIEYA